MDVNFVNFDMKDVTKFLNRLLGLTPAEQNVIFDYFTAIFEKVVMNAKQTRSVRNAFPVLLEKV